MFASTACSWAGAGILALGLVAAAQPVGSQSTDDPLWPMMSGFPLDWGMAPYSPDMGSVMGGGPGYYGALNVSEEQQDKIDELHDDLRRTNWELQGRVFDERDKLRDLFRADTPDPEAVDRIYANLFDLERQMIVNRVKANNNILGVLTLPQRDRLRELRRARGAPAGGMMGSPGAYGGHGMGGPRAAPGADGGIAPMPRSTPNR